jgi:hypothetical protein
MNQAAAGDIGASALIDKKIASLRMPCSMPVWRAMRGALSIFARVKHST